jgi:hypothetical protein
VNREERETVYKNLRLDCYTVYTSFDGDGYNNHFPRTEEGLKLAENLIITRGGYGLHEDTVWAHQIMPYICVCEENLFQDWCKAWNVTP